VRKLSGALQHTRPALARFLIKGPPHASCLSTDAGAGALALESLILKGQHSAGARSRRTAITFDHEHSHVLLVQGNLII